MAQVNLFLLLPETDPKNQWMRSTEADFDKAEAYKNLIHALKKISERIAIGWSLQNGAGRYFLYAKCGNFSLFHCVLQGFK